MKLLVLRANKWAPINFARRPQFTRSCIVRKFAWVHFHPAIDRNVDIIKSKNIPLYASGLASHRPATEKLAAQRWHNRRYVLILHVPESSGDTAKSQTNSSLYLSLPTNGRRSHAIHYILPVFGVLLHSNEMTNKSKLIEITSSTHRYYFASFKQSAFHPYRWRAMNIFRNGIETLNKLWTVRHAVQLDEGALAAVLPHKSIVRMMAYEWGHECERRRKKK